MYNYLIFSACTFLIFVFFDHISQARLYRQKKFFLYLFIFLLFTVVFDNLTVKIGIVQYDFRNKTIGLRIPFMPIEDLFYGLCLGYFPIIILKGSMKSAKDAMMSFLLISRPKLWTNTFVICLWVLLVYKEHITFVLGILLFYFIFPYNYLVYGVNDYFDRASDLVNERKGKLDGALKEQSFFDMTLTITLSQLPFLLIFGFYLPQIMPLFLILIFAAVTYSAKPFRFKEIPILDSINSSVHFVLPFFITLIAVKIHPLPYLLIIAFFFWGMGSQSMGAIQDITADTKAGIKSIATFLGKKATTYYAVCCYLLSVGLLLVTKNTSTILLGIVCLLYPISTSRILFSKKDTIANTVWDQFLILNYIIGFLITQYMLIPFWHK